MTGRFAAAVFVVLALAGCTTTTTVAAPPSPDHGNHEAVRALGSQHCGIERWPVKTGIDADAAMVSLTDVTPATAASLVTLPAPAAPPQDSPVRPGATAVYRVTARLTGANPQADCHY